MLNARRGKRYIAVSWLLVFLSPFFQQTTAGRSIQESPKPDSKIVTAKTAFLTSAILFPKTDKDSFSGELNEILRIADSTRIWSVYRRAASTQAELIIKIAEDRTLGAKWTLTLYVYDPEDNTELYKEERDFVTLSNDVTRLINHLVDHVLEERTRIREKYEQGLGPARITCESVNLFANRAAVRRVVRVLKKGDVVKITVLANDEVIVKLGDVGGYVDAQCVELLSPPSSKD